MSKAEHWQRIKEIFQFAIELEANKRQAYLDSSCQDAEMRKEVEKLINNFLKVEENNFLNIGIINKLTEEIYKNSPSTTEVKPLVYKSIQPKEKLLPNNEKEIKDPLIGNIFAHRYHIEKILGQGGTGVVYLVKDTLLNKPRAIKILLREVQKRLDLQTRFIREAKATQKIKHKNLITIYELSKTDDNKLYLVMEYIDGVDLRQIIEERKKQGKSFLPQEAFNLLKPILEALEAIHLEGIIHRDIKPDNILLGKDENGNNVIKLTDLGIAKFVNIPKFVSTPAIQLTAIPLTAIGTLIGTPYYMAPEQWGEKPKDAKDNGWKVDKRIDIYSIGIILYEMISLEKPFNSTNILSLSKQHTSKIATALNQLIPTVTESFAQVVAKSMAKDRTDRFTTITDLVNSLEEALKIESSQTNSDTSQVDVEARSVENGQHNSSLINQVLAKIKRLFH